jgi:transcriptional regulator with GAF, ATPase, and Fis domain
MRLSPEIIGQSPEFLRMLKIPKMVAPTDATVLITRESGTGNIILTGDDPS